MASRTPLLHRLAPILLAISIASCASIGASSSRSVGLDASIHDRLYFGRSIPGGGSVSQQEWSDFLTGVVTPRFPSGLTVLRAEGQWRDSGGAIVREESFVLELIHPDDPESERVIAEIIAEYRRMFRQESVMRVRSVVLVGF